MHCLLVAAEVFSESETTLTALRVTGESSVKFGVTPTISLAKAYTRAGECAYLS